jgi:hypothetical protein
MSAAPKPAPAHPGWKRVSVQEARELSKKPGVLVWWRPEIHLPEEQQYCLVRK